MHCTRQLVVPRALIHFGNVPDTIVISANLSLVQTQNCAAAQRVASSHAFVNAPFHAVSS